MGVTLCISELFNDANVLSAKEIHSVDKYIIQ